MKRKLYRSRKDKIIWGVCGGLAEYFAIDPVIVRVIFVLVGLSGGAGVLAYIILAIVIPQESSEAKTTEDVVRENVEEIKNTASELGHEIESTFAGGKERTEDEARVRHRRLTFLGIIIVVIGIVFLLGSLDFFWWFNWRILWPLVLVAIGITIILSAKRKNR